MYYKQFWVICLAECDRKSAQYQFTKFGRLTPKNIREGANYFEVTLSNWKASFKKKKQGGLSNKEKLPECLIFDSGCIGWQNTPKILQISIC